jgi:endonuclease YncB( thermonuclease family)
VSGTWLYPVRTDHTGRPIIVEEHDADTFRLCLDAGCETGLWPWLRLKGCDAPELDTPEGVAARDYMHGLLTGATKIRARLHGRSFARWVATVWIDGTDAAELLIAAGMAVPYQ